MLRTIFSIGLFALLGLFALRLVFGIFTFAFAIVGALLVLAVKITLIGGAVYLVIRVVSPDTARRLLSRSRD
jgi:hypothetical protein